MAPTHSSQTQHFLFTRLHGSERRSSLLSRCENGHGLAIVPALVASQDEFSDSPRLCRCSYQTNSPTLRRGTSLPNLHCQAFEPASLIASDDNERAQSPETPSLSSRPIKFRLDEEEKVKHSSIMLLDGAARCIVARSSSCGASPSQVLGIAQHEFGPSPSQRFSVSRSLPSPAQLSCFVYLADDGLAYEEILSRTPPDRILAHSYGALPTPRVPKKSNGIRSAPLGKKKPRRLQFGDMEGCDCPETSCSSNALAESGTLGRATKNHPCLGYPDKSDSRRGAEPLQSSYDVGQSGSLQIFAGFPLEGPQTPPDKMFNSFARISTPAAPKKLPRKSLEVSLSDREGRS